MRETLLALLLLSMSFPPAASFPPEAAPGPDPATFLLLRLEEGKEGIVGAQLADEESLADLGLTQSQIGNELKIQSEHQDVQLKNVPQLNTKTKTILDSIEAMAADESSHHDVLDITKDGLEVNQKALDILDQIRDQEPDAEGRKCVKKVMMREETVYEEVMTCHHSYDQRCHDSYITTYEPHQEEECEETERREDCRTVYDTVCDTRQVGYEVEEDFPNCTTVNMEKCEDVTVGLKTERRCEVWPTQRCSVDTKTVQHTSPTTQCRKEPRTLCTPGDCPHKTGPVQCQEKMKTVMIETPQEQCDLEPQKVCTTATKMVPQ